MTAARLALPLHRVYVGGMETPMVQVKRAFPTWQVQVDGKVVISGIWRRSVAVRLAEATK